jgi:ribosomal protein L14E/L6E/L27E
MEIEQLKQIDQIKEGDLLLISDGKEITHAKAQRVKVSEHDGTEVIFNLRKNKYFNVGMYLDGKSWAKDVRIVRMSSNAKLSRTLERSGSGSD